MSSLNNAEFKLNLLRSAKGSRLTCVARVLKAGSTLTVVESEVFCETAEASRLVSKATVTLAIVKPRSSAESAGSCH
jgi:acyl-coenzyme A thioesterase PaaI-like protein